jgi:hypothetical protein
MNERMLDLAIQAKDWAYADHDGYTAQMLFEQKFAELIVRECCQFENSYSGDARLVSRHYGRRIREHFGVDI